MRIVVTEVRPKPRLVDAARPQWFDWFSSKREISVCPEEIAFIRNESDIGVAAAEGSQPLALALPSSGQILLVSRNSEIYFTAHDCSFANSLEADGSVQFWMKLRFLAAGTRSHPLAAGLRPEFSVESFQEGLALALTHVLRGLQDRAFSGFDYAPQSAAALSAHVEKASDAGEIKSLLQRHAGAASDGRLTVLGMACRDIDNRIRQEGRQTKLAEENRNYLAELTLNASRKAAEDGLAHHRQMAAMQHHLDIERAEARRRLEELENQLKERDIQTAIALLDQRKRGELMEKQARVAKTRAEQRLLEEQTEAIRQDVANKNEAYRRAQAATEQTTRQLSRLNVHVVEMARTLQEQNEAMRQRMAVLEETLEELTAPKAPPSEKSLTLGVEWRAYNDSGVIVPRLGACERLFAGAMLNVAVTVSRDAYVYILLKDSSGQWISLLPDTTDLMGIEADNFQRAGEIAVWPGTNRLKPELPFWMLDNRPGYERLMVVASLDRFDPVQELRERGRIAARGFWNPADAPDASASIGMDYERALRILTGEGRVVHESVIDHQ